MYNVSQKVWCFQGRKEEGWQATDVRSACANDMSNYINETTVMEFYIEQLDAGKVMFLEAREDKKAFVRKSVEDLMNAENMNSKIVIACGLWKALFEAAMSTLDPDRQGYDGILKFFDAYVEFEELIFASDSFYRDHTLHCIWVYFLGEYIKRNKQFESLFLDEKKDVNIFSAFDVAAKKVSVFKESDLRKIEIFNKLFALSEKYSEASRCISALTHDLGYPLKKIEKINKSINKVLPYFAINNADEFTFEYSNVQQEFIKDFIETISREFEVDFKACDDITREELEKSNELFKQIFVFDGKGNVTGTNVEAIEALDPKDYECVRGKVEIGHSFRLKMSQKNAYLNDFENYQHGIMSAFLLAKNIPAFQRFDYDVKDSRLDFSRLENTVRQLSLQNILQSISFHTCELMKIREITDTTYLTFVDELEEFSRISRASQNREYVKEFCETSLYMDQDGWFNVDFVFSNRNLDNLDPERAFKGRCKRFLTLFDTSTLSENLKIRVNCIGKLDTDSNTYTLEVARKHAVVMINGEQQDIPRYLKSSQFLRTEEYAEL